MGISLNNIVLLGGPFEKCDYLSINTMVHFSDLREGGSQTLKSSKMFFQYADHGLPYY